MSFGPDLGNNPLIEYWISPAIITSESQIPSSLTAGTGFGAGASFTYTSTSQDILEGHVYVWSGSAWNDVTGSVETPTSATAHGLVSYADTTGESLESISTITVGANNTLTGGAASDFIIAAGTNRNIQMTPNGSGSFQVTGTSGFTGNMAVTGSIGASTTITAGTNLATTNGNLVLGAAGNKIVRSAASNTTAAGANSAGTVTLTGGTATVATTSVTASSLIDLSRMSIGATGASALGQLSVGTITPGVSFVINSVQAADATALQASDVSVIKWSFDN
jgi:hypothetical protein